MIYIVNIMNILKESSRLLLRKFQLKDAKDFYNLNNDVEVLKYTGDKAFASEEEAKIFIFNYDHYKKYGYGRWSIIRKNDNVYLGFCGLKWHPQKHEVDIGFRILKKYWGMGYATEAARASLELGLEKFGLRSYVGRTRVENIASQKVLEKLGFVYDFSFEEENCKWHQYKLELHDGF